MCGVRPAKCQDQETNQGEINPKNQRALMVKGIPPGRHEEELRKTAGPQVKKSRLEFRISVEKTVGAQIGCCKLSGGHLWGR